MTALAREIEENGSHAEDFTLKFNSYLPYNEKTNMHAKNIKSHTCLFLNRPKNNEVPWCTNPFMPKVHRMWSFSLHSNSLIQICLSCYSNKISFFFFKLHHRFLAMACPSDVNKSPN